MRALQIDALHPPRLAQVSDPVPAPGEVLIKVTTAGVNPVDLMVAQGAIHPVVGREPEESVGTGWDIVGVVVEAADDAGSALVGRRVAALLSAISLPSGGHADLVSVPASAVAPIPDEVTDAAAVTLPLNAVTAEQALDAIGDLAGRSLLITGAAGAVGAFALAGAQRRGWTPDALARESDRGFIEQWGGRLVTEVPDANAPGYDVVLDAASMREPALALVRDGGVFIDLIGMAPLPPERDITVESFFVSPDGHRLTELLDLAADSKIPLRSAGEVSLDDFSQAFEAVAQPGRRGHWAIRP